MTQVATIWCTIKVPGFHAWAGAIEEVKFLSFPHRHIFHIKASFKVSHEDRDLEFFMCQRALREFMFETYADYEHKDLGFDFGNRSCEMIAREILAGLYPAPFSVEVSEDGENGAIV